ncbi:MAG: hypothetical protein RML75_16845, partial [Cyanobacteriota bacterium SKYGB_h_bin112]|nr:hypothetical protein [Cyanobacteriota bacterium SKYGB_h_bin112]
MMPDQLASQVGFLQSHPEVVCIGGAHDFIDEAGRALFHWEELEQDTDIQRSALRSKTLINHPSAMIRRSGITTG